MSLYRIIDLAEYLCKGKPQYVLNDYTFNYVQPRLLLYLIGLLIGAYRFRRDHATGLVSPSTFYNLAKCMFTSLGFD